MAHEVILPRVDMDMEAGKITRWFVAEGAPVKKGQPLFEIETDKAAMEIDAPADGIARGLHGELAVQIPVGTVVGWICGPDEVYAPVAASVQPPIAAPVVEIAPHVESAVEPLVTLGLRATPKARRLARERGLSLESLVGSGPLGRIQASDVETAQATRLNREWLSRGKGAPIVLLHGFGGDLNGFRPLNGHLKTGRGRLALDLPGHGLSALDGEVSVQAFTAAISATLAAEGVEAFHLVAHSLGAVFAAAFAASSPSQVRSLTLMAPAGLGPEIHADFTRGFLAAQSETSLAPWLAELVVDPAALGSAMVKSTLRQRQARPLVETQARIASAFFPDGTQANSIRTALQRYPGPTRVIFGLEDRIVPARHARGLPGAIGVHMFPNVGHMPHFEARSEVADIIEDNVAAGERRAGSASAG